MSYALSAEVRTLPGPDPSPSYPWANTASSPSHADGTSITVEASGPQADAAIAALATLVASKFDED